MKYYYYPIFPNDLIDILSSKSINLNTLDYKYIYTKPINETGIILKFRLKGYEQRQLIKIDDSTRLLNKPIQFEDRNFELICENESIYSKIYLLIDDFIQTKFLYENQISINEKLFSNSSLETVKYNYSNNIHLDEYNHGQIISFDNLKGFLYLFFTYFENLDIHIEETLGIYNQEIKNIEDSINSLRKNNLLKGNLYNQYKNLLTTLTKNNSRYISDKLNLYKFINKSNIVNYNMDIFIDSKDFNLINSILVLLINRTKKLDKMELNNIIIKLQDSFIHNDTFSVYKSDINIIHERVLKQNYLVSVDEIENTILKNFFAFAINHNNILHLDNFLEEKNISEIHWAYSFFGAFHGYKDISNSIIHYSEPEPNINNFFINKFIDEADTIYYSNEYNLIYNRDRIHYLLISILNNRNLQYILKNNTFFSKLNLFINYSIKGSFHTIEISDNQIDSIKIEYWKPTATVSGDLADYFFNRTKRILKYNKNIAIKNDDFIFHYNFGLKDKTYPYSPELEKKYMVILNYINKNLKEDL